MTRPRLRSSVHGQSRKAGLTKQVSSRTTNDLKLFQTYTETSDERYERYERKIEGQYEKLIVH